MATATLTLTALAADSVAPIPLGDTIDADATCTLPGIYAPERTIILVENLDAALDAVVTLLAGADPPAHSAGQGDLSFTVNGSGGTFPQVVCYPATSARWVQADGTLLLSVALGGGDGVRITAYTLPRL